MLRQLLRDDFVYLSLPTNPDGDMPTADHTVTSMLEAADGAGVKHVYCRSARGDDAYDVLIRQMSFDMYRIRVPSGCGDDRGTRHRNRRPGRSSTSVAPCNGVPQQIVSAVMRRFGDAVAFRQCGHAALCHFLITSATKVPCGS